MSNFQQKAYNGIIGGLVILSVVLSWLAADYQEDAQAWELQSIQLRHQLEKAYEAHQQALDAIQHRHAKEMTEMHVRINFRDSLLCHCVQWDIPTQRFIWLLQDFNR